jgi:hypothetical protein
MPGLMRHIPTQVRTIALIAGHFAFGLEPVLGILCSASLTFLPTFLVLFPRCQWLVLDRREIELLPNAARLWQSHTTIQPDCHLSQLRCIEFREPGGCFCLAGLNHIIIVVKGQMPLARMNTDMQRCRNPIGFMRLESHDTERMFLGANMQLMAGDFAGIAIHDRRELESATQPVCRGFCESWDGQPVSESAGGRLASTTPRHCAKRCWAPRTAIRSARFGRWLKLILGSEPDSAGAQCPQPARSGRIGIRPQNHCVSQFCEVRLMHVAPRLSI